MFLGGWLLPFGIDPPTWVDPFVVLVKMFIFVFFFMWVRATLPRLRYDQLMSLRLEDPAAAGDAQRTRDRDRPGGDRLTPPYDPGADVVAVQRGPQPVRRRAAPTARSARPCAA